MENNLKNLQEVQLDLGNPEDPKHRTVSVNILITEHAE